MKKNGFTLIELLGVVTIIGVLALILFPSLLRQINKSKSSISEANELLIIDAAKDYVEDNINNYKKIKGINYCIDISTLDKYLLDLKDENLKEIDKTKKVKMTYTNKFDYDIVDSCTNSLTRGGLEVPIVSENPGLYESTTEPGRFIYRGNYTEVKNWIWLDENGDGVKTSSEFYRIISYENDGTIKVIRQSRIGSIKWDDATARYNTNPEYYCTDYNGCHVWGNQENTYYNDATLSSLGRDFFFQYYLDNTTENLTNGPGGTVSTDAYLNTYLNNTWYDTLSFKDSITEHKYNVGGIYYTDAYTGGGKGIKKEKEEESLLSWYGKIGLMNITEYVESSLNPACTSVYSNYFYNIAYKDGINGKDKNEAIPPDWPCYNTNYNWMSVGTNEWSITAFSKSNHYVWHVSLGYFNGGMAETSDNVRPAFYLKSTTVLGGEGTSNNPFYIKNT